MERDKQKPTVDVSAKKADFVLKVPSEQLLSRVNPGPTLAGVLRNVSAVVATKDIYNLRKSGGDKNAVITVVPLPEAELFALLRSVKDTNGVDVFAQAKIEMGKAQIPPTYGIQTYVDMRKIASAPQRDQFLESVGATGSKNGCAYIMIYEGSEKYAALLIPPIVINYPKSVFQDALNRADEMAKNGVKITIKGVAGDVTLDLVSMVRTFKETMAGPSDTIPVVLEGTHRSYACYKANIPLNAIIVSGIIGTLTNLPVRFQDIVEAAEYPAERERRYLATKEGVRIHFEGIGISPR